ncbi:hypothetical protein AT268_31765 [Bacillus cereus]|uniref:DUF1523 domain-containing protein n=1 Tax=Bacillus cereus TaxID=1396 RepID=A0A9X0MJR5_BACCE|nr:DUF1523 family protein [Bacillus cereus]KXY51082.1 hypothetical protein AT268_31765 [Bacillus cereus]PEZ75241.1 DUF1523 domain-containing protein [Bacillus anthracis]
MIGTTRKSWMLIGFVFLMLLAIVGEIVNYTHITTVKGEVIEKYSKRQEEVDKFYIVVKQNNDSEKVIVNEDSLLMFKFDSADVQAKIHQGEEYEFKLRGYRVPILSLFPNVDTVVEKQ